jgi:ATP/ADP translocase
MVFNYQFIFPRISLFIAYCNNQIPHNNIPFFGDLISAVIVPRILILVYIGSNLGCDTGWFIIHLIACIIAMTTNAIVWNERMKNA